MKNTYRILILLLLLSASPLNAQFIRGYGIKAGYTNATQAFDYKTGAVFSNMLDVTGYNFAAYAELIDFPFISAVAQIEFTRRGTGLEFVITGPNGPEPLGTLKVYSKLDYISVPVMAKMRVPLLIGQLYFLAGPRFDHYLGFRNTYEAPAGYVTTEPIIFFNYDKFKKNIFGYSAGMGFETSSLLPVGVLVEFRINRDLQDSYSSETVKIRNDAWDIWVGIKL